jgi:hypothetical protein
MPTITIPFAFTLHNAAIATSNLTTLHSIMHLDPENLASCLVLIALLTYFYTAFSKIFQPGGDQQQKSGRQTFSKLESRIYYYSAAAV